MTSSIQKPTPEKVNVLREIWRAGSLEIPNVSLPLNPFIPQTSGDPTFWQLLFRAKQNRSTLYKLITATVIMICAPLLTFFAARSYLFYSYNFNDQLVYSGFAAVLMVNVVSFGFVFFAWFLDPSDDEVPVGPKQKEVRRLFLPPNLPLPLLPRLHPCPLLLLHEHQSSSNNNNNNNNRNNGRKKQRGELKMAETLLSVLDVYVVYGCLRHLHDQISSLQSFASAFGRTYQRLYWLVRQTSFDITALFIWSDLFLMTIFTKQHHIQSFAIMQSNFRRSCS